MSLPLSRRIAQAALLLGAAAAPLLGAGAAHAAAPQQAGVGGLTALDGTQLGHTVDTTSHKATTLASQGTTQATDTTGRLVGTTTESLPVSGALPDTGALPTTDQLPVNALPLG